MKLLTLASLAALSLSSAGYALTLEEESQLIAGDAVAALRRALPNSPSGYTPSFIDCPGSSPPSVRSASSLSPNETAWVEKRRINTVASMQTFLDRLNISDFDAQSYIQRHADNASALPNIGIAVSGGGYRALLNGAGVLRAFDNRTENSTDQGHLGGLLQSATYLAGLSGGSWLVGSLFLNNFTTVSALLEDGTGSAWDFSNSILQGPDTRGIKLFNSVSYYSTLEDGVSGKDDAGFETTLTDYWGRALSFQLINDTNGGPAYTWSSVALADHFQNGETPFPIIIADERAPGELLIPGNTTIYEFNPFEMGTWDPTAYGFVPTQYLGTNFTEGAVPSGDQCVIGYDNGGYIMGTSSSIFNQILFGVNSTDLPSFLQDVLNDLLSAIGVNDEDIADYSPNPFFQYNPDSNPSADATTLTLVDGGEDNQNIPLQPLIQPFRGIDVIFAVDSSADTSSWPNASAMVATYERSQPINLIANGTTFPSIPDQNTVVNLGLNTRPTFFGCNASNFTGDHLPPLIVYLPNSPYSAFSNVSTFDLSYNNTQRNDIVLNGYNVATMGNGTLDSEWAACAGCAILSRSFDRTGTTVPDACVSCFQKYCWDGTLNSTTPAPYEPTLALDAASSKTSSTAISTQSGGSISSASSAGSAATASSTTGGGMITRVSIWGVGVAIVAVVFLTL